MKIGGKTVPHPGPAGAEGPQGSQGTQGVTGATGPAGSSPRMLRITIDGGGAVITTGAKKIYLSVPYTGTITKVRCLADVSGSITVDFWKDTYANFPPVAADKISASAPATLSSAQKSEDSTLTGWTTSVTTGDIIEVSVATVSTVTRVFIDLFITV